MAFGWFLEPLDSFRTPFRPLLRRCGDAKHPVAAGGHGGSREARFGGLRDSDRRVGGASEGQKGGLSGLRELFWKLKKTSSELFRT